MRVETKETLLFFLVLAMKDMSIQNGTAENGGQFTFLHFGPVVTLIQHVLGIFALTYLETKRVILHLMH